MNSGPSPSRGRRHPLPPFWRYVRGQLCGYRSYSAMADWGRCYGQKLARALGFTHAKTPCAATCTTSCATGRALVEATLGAWADSVRTPAPAPGEPEAMALEGKPCGAVASKGPQPPICSRHSVIAWG